MEIGQLINQNTYTGTLGTFFGIAMLAATARTAIRIHEFGRLHVDDYFLFLATAALIGSTGLFLKIIPSLYFFAKVILGHALPPKNSLQEAIHYSIYGTIGEVLCWTTIFAVKFSFLFYFRSLVRRLHNLTILWWCTFVILTPVAITMILGTFIVCPYVGSELLTHCVAGIQFLRREYIVLYYSVISDILTDALLISIPVALLWQAQFKVRQKLSIGIVLCLSIIMIAIGMVRGITAHIYGTNDQAWASFWVEIEACISVIMVSMTAFRTLFVVSEKGRKKASPRRYDGRTSRERLWGKQSKPELPSLQTAVTMTGLRTLIRENGRTTLGSFGQDHASV